MRYYEFQNFGGRTQNQQELNTALSKPGVVFETSNDLTTAKRVFREVKGK
jgi:hypothetical protein